MNIPEKIEKLIQVVQPKDPDLFKHDLWEWSQKEVAGLDDCLDHLFNLFRHCLPMPWDPEYDKAVVTFLLERSKETEQEFRRKFENPWGAFMKVKWQDGQPCNHKGCMAHVSHKCEGCGRVGAIGVVYEGLPFS